VSETFRDPRAAEDLTAFDKGAHENTDGLNVDLHPPARQRVGFAIGGGGSRGAFGVGAINHLTS
jgi:predicted acylesterase/phospholipase RssA